MASTFIKGASVNFESLLDISVLPTPVGPIMRIFFGKTSSFISPFKACLLHLFLSAIATALFAAFCPMTYRSNSETISLGDKEVTLDFWSKVFLISGTGDVLEPEGGIIGIGSGGNYALAAAKVLIESKMSAEEIARKSIKVASEICVFTNNNITLEKI